MAKFHVNSENGRYGSCKAKPGNCPVSGEEEHFHNKEAVIQASEQILSQKHGTTNSLKKKNVKRSDKKNIDLPSDIFKHPKGYEFYKAMENAKTSTEQMEIVRKFDYGFIDKSLIVGEDTKEFIDELHKQKDQEDYLYLESKDVIAPECSFVAIEDANKKYTVWLLDEDGNNLGTTYNTDKDEAYEKIREIWNNS